MEAKQLKKRDACLIKASPAKFSDVGDASAVPIPTIF